MPVYRYNFKEYCVFSKHLLHLEQTIPLINTFKQISWTLPLFEIKETFSFLRQQEIQMITRKCNRNSEIQNYNSKMSPVTNFRSSKSFFSSHRVLFLKQSVLNIQTKRYPLQAFLHSALINF